MARRLFPVPPQSEVMEREKMMAELESSLKQAVSEKAYILMMKNQGFTDNIARLHRELTAAQEAEAAQRGEVERVRELGLKAVKSAQAASEREHSLQDAAQAQIVQKLVDKAREGATRAVADAQDQWLRSEEDLRRAQLAHEEAMTTTVTAYEARVASLQERIAAMERGVSMRTQMDTVALKMTEEELETELEETAAAAQVKQAEERARYSKKVGAAHLQIRQLITAAESAGQALEKLRLKEIEINRMNATMDELKRQVDDLQVRLMRAGAPSFEEGGRLWTDD